MKTLIIVESPTKIRSLSHFLNKNYQIKSSKGHLIDLPKSRMGIDIEDNFEPSYVTIRGKGPTLADLKKSAKKVERILLATDPDREGEAISWHLFRVLSAYNDNISRIEFNEITKEAVLYAIAHPRKLDEAKINSQQARRLLDRLVGYSVSPVLQDKFGSKRFSAGRVQSAVLKILCDRESEIQAFLPREYWEAEATFFDKKQTLDDSFLFQLVKKNNKKCEIPNDKEMKMIEEEIKGSSFRVSSIKTTERSTKPSSPYTTSKLQQEASTRVNFRVRRTMSIAQSLYEGVDLSKQGSVGLVTYIRTDSTRISDSGMKMCRDYIRENLGHKFLSEKPRIYSSSKQAQDAHEAIRPTDMKRTPQSIKASLSADQYKIYKLIWDRFAASQMVNALDQLITTEVVTNGKENQYLFKHFYSREVFPGFRVVMGSSKKQSQKPVKLAHGEELTLDKFFKYQKFTQPPARYTEASLIKIMEESGIGRPATYSPTIATLDSRSYIERKGRQLLPTWLGMIVNKLLSEYFANIVNVQFTADMEEKLDIIAQGKSDWRKMLQNFFGPLQNDIDYAFKNMESQRDLIRINLDRKCPGCTDGNLYKKLGKNGFFIGCDKFIEGCRYAESIPMGDCPKCDGKVVAKKNKKNRKFYGCSNYSSTGCDFIMLEKPSDKSCPKCKLIMSEKVLKKGITYTCCNPDCAFVVNEETQEHATVS